MFCRVGGKTRLKTRIVELIPDHKIYVEPFIGGGSVFFKKKLADLNIINDLDVDIYNIYSDMSIVGDQLKDADFTADREKFYKLLNTTDLVNKKFRLYRNLYLSINSFVGDRASYNKHRETKKNSGIKYKTDKWKNLLDRENIMILNKDWKQVVTEYDSPDTFFYFDPPYENMKKYSVGSVDINHLFNVLSKIKGKWILSYKNCEKIKNLFFEYTIRLIETVHTISSKQINIEEILICNF